MVDDRVYKRGALFPARALRLAAGDDEFFT